MPLILARSADGSRLSEKVDIKKRTMTRDELKKTYKQNPPAMGIFQIKNVQNGKIFVGSSLNLAGILNRHKFTLELGSHNNKSLQSDWNEYGAENFQFEVLDYLKPKDDPGHNYSQDLLILEELWLEKLQPFGERGYNKA
jgi:group I intron endonuclease